jgi:hypothetical protein
MNIFKKLKINVWSEQSKHIFLRNFTKFIWIQSNKKNLGVLYASIVLLHHTTLCHPFTLINFLLCHYSTTAHYFAIPLCKQFAMHCATPLCRSILHATFHATLPCHLVKYLYPGLYPPPLATPIHSFYPLLFVSPLYHGMLLRHYALLYQFVGNITMQYATPLCPARYHTLLPLHSYILFFLWNHSATSCHFTTLLCHAILYAI